MALHAPNVAHFPPFVPLHPETGNVRTAQNLKIPEGPHKAILRHVSKGKFGDLRCQRPRFEMRNSLDLCWPVEYGEVFWQN